MADRDAKLRILVELVGMDKAAHVAALFGERLDDSGDAAESAAVKIAGAAEAVETLEAAEADAAATAGDTTAALQNVGDAALQSGAALTEAAQGGANAIGEVVAAAGEQAAASQEAGNAGREAGEEIAEGAKLAARSVTEVVAEFEETITAAKAAGLAFDGQAAVESVGELTAAIRASNDDLETQREALHGLASQLADDLAAVKSSSTGAGTETVAQGKLIEGALAKVRAEIAIVDASLRAVGDAGTSGGEQTRSSFLSVSDALALANASAREATEQLEETGRLPKASIRELAEIIETVNIAMERSANTSDAATETQIQNVEALKVNLAGLTEITNRQTNASGDNAVALKETGDQVAGLTGAIGGLINVSGSGSTIFGTMVQKIGQGASAFERAKDAAKALDLNTLGAAKSATGLIGQLTAIIAVAVAAAAAGLKLAQTNKENAEAMGDATDAAEKMLPTMASVRDGWNGVQTALTNVLVDLDQFVRRSNDMGDSAAELTDRTRALVNVTDSYDKRSRDLADTLSQINIALLSGRSGVDLYTIALRDGFTAEQAYALAVKDSAEVLQFYENVRRTGAEGQALWNQAIRESGGSAVMFQQRVTDLTPAMTELMGAHRQMSDELQKEYDARQKLNAAMATARGLAEAERERQMAATDETRQAVELAITQNEVVNGTTVALRSKLAAIAEDIEQSDVHSVALARVASAAQEVLDSTDGLTRAERERHQIVIDLAARANDLTDAEQRYVAELVKAIETGNKATITLRTRAVATTELADAVRQMTESERLAFAADEVRREGLQTQLDLIREQIELMERSQGVRRTDARVNEMAGASLDYLRMKEQQLQAEMEVSLTSWSAESDAKTENIETSAALIAQLSHERIAYDSVASSSTRLQTIMVDGKVVYTNLTEAQRTQAAASVELANAHGKISVSSEGAAAAMRSLVGTTPAATRELTELLGVGRELAAVMDEVAINIKRANDEAARAASD